MGIWYACQIDRGFSHPPRFHSHCGLSLAWVSKGRKTGASLKQVGKNSYPSELPAKPKEVHSLRKQATFLILQNLKNSWLIDIGSIKRWTHRLHMAYEGPWRTSSFYRVNIEREAPWKHPFHRVPQKFKTYFLISPNSKNSKTKKALWKHPIHTLAQ